MANHDDKGHSNRQNSNIAHLVNQVADIPGRNKIAISRDCKKYHDDNQSDKHKIIANICFYELPKTV